VSAARWLVTRRTGRSAPAAINTLVRQADSGDAAAASFHTALPAARAKGLTSADLLQHINGHRQVADIY
jgi:hypothetical protein